MRFQELWSVEPLLRLATLDTVMEFLHGREAMIPCPPPVRSAAANARPDVPAYFEERRPDILRVRLEHIVNPQHMIENFRPSPIDEEEYSPVSRALNLVRPVGAVALPSDIASPGAFRDFLARLAAYFPSQGFRAASPHELYRQWCALEGVQPVAEPVERPIEQEQAIVRLGRVLAHYDVDTSYLDRCEIIDQIYASSGSGRSFQSHMRALTEQVHRVAHYAGATSVRGELIDIDEVALRAFLPLTVIEDLRDYAMRNNLHFVSTDININVTSAAEYRDVQHAMLAREIFGGADPASPAPSTPSRGIVIPINHPGRRHINVENQHETRDTLDASDRLHAHRPGSGSRDARRPRRPLGLDD